MMRIWTWDNAAVTLALTDFLDPALAEQPDARERGVRLELCEITWGPIDSVYSSPAATLQPAIVRIDLLESAPHKADRMHYHPDMVDGDPGDRVFVPEMPEDPIGWLRDFLTDLRKWVGADDASAINTASTEIASEAERLLDIARQPWPSVVHDERGLAAS